MSINAVEKSLLPAVSLAHAAAPNAPEHTISTRLVVFLAAAVAIISLNLYASQPLIGLIGPSLGMSPSAASLVTTFTLLGYAAGLVLLVPLVDLMANRRLIVL